MTNICEAICDSLFKEHFEVFLKQHKLPYSGTKKEMIDRIENFIVRPSERDSFERFLVDQLKYNKNKQLFYCNLGIVNQKILRNKTSVKQKLAAKKLPSEPFNNLLNENPNNNDILYLDFLFEENKIQSIEMCVFKEIQPKEQDTSNSLLYNYVWVELNVEEDFMLTRVRNQQHMQNYYTTRSIFKEIKEKIEEIFSIHLNINMLTAKETLYKMYSEFILKAELPYHKMVEDISDKITASQNPIFEALKIDNNSNTAISIISRYKKLLERILILEGFEIYNDTSNDKIAIVEKISMSDDTGASAHILPGDEDGLDVATIYFDVRDTIDEMKILNKLWLRWFYKKEEAMQLNLFKDKEVEIEQYSTRMEVYKSFVIITFMTQQSIEREVQEYVFNSFRRFEKVSI